MKKPLAVYLLWSVPELSATCTSQAFAAATKFPSAEVLSFISFKESLLEMAFSPYLVSVKISLTIKAGLFEKAVCEVLGSNIFLPFISKFISGS